jgi:hypothetical protein
MTIAEKLESLRSVIDEKEVLVKTIQGIIQDNWNNPNEWDKWNQVLILAQTTV